VQSVENLCWKLARVHRGDAPFDLLQTYDLERSQAADENIQNSTRATDFITPKNRTSRVFRDEVLRLAEVYPFATKLINSGRLSQPCVLTDSPLNTPDADEFGLSMQVGSVCRDAPILINSKPAWLLQQLGGHFTLLVSGTAEEKDAMHSLEGIRDLHLVCLGFENDSSLPSVDIADSEGFLKAAYQLEPGTCYLVRPDQHVCARWRQVDADLIRAAMDRAMGRELITQNFPI
jgi:3-(3-hydroxy-phenyl)propionate hydroxylase